MILVTLTITVPFVTWMLIGFFKNLPRVERLAQIDGFSRMATLIRIVIPMARVGIAIGAVIAFLFAWNEYTFAMILVRTAHQPLRCLLRFRGNPVPAPVSRAIGSRRSLFHDTAIHYGLSCATPYHQDEYRRPSGRLKQRWQRFAQNCYERCSKDRCSQGPVIGVIRDKELLVILGPTGCGKTTTLNCIAGLERPTSGRVFFDQEDVTDWPPHRRNIAMVFQSSLLYPHLTARDNILKSLKRTNLSKEEANKRLSQASSMLQIEAVSGQLCRRR